MNRHKLIPLICFLMLSFFLQAQNDGLPHEMTRDEGKNMPTYLENFNNNDRGVDPPTSPVRTMGEWEEAQALLITWTGFPDVLTEIVRHSVDELTVIIVTNNETSVSNILTNEDIPLDNVVFMDEGYNSIWIRDYGPWTVYVNDVDSLSITDWIYNRPRPLDDVIPTHVAEYFNIPIYEAIEGENALVHTGGNHLVDGMGTAFSSSLIFNENDEITEADIDAIGAAYLGIDNYIKFPVLPYDVIHHLDMHMRLIDEETIIFAEYPEGVADGPQINANIEYLLNNHTTAFGNPWNIVRIPSPPEGGDYPDNGGDYRTYTNAIFVNKTILVPVYEEQYDNEALAIYEENLPGYNVVGIDCNSIIGSLGALHCITKLVGVSDPLWIAHARLRDTYNTTDDYAVDAIIKHPSGILNAQMYYKTDLAADYEMLEMTMANADENIWSAAIPAQDALTTVYYYIAAEANSGKTQVRPIVAPEGYFKFDVLEITGPPVVEFAINPGQICVGETITFSDFSTENPESWAWEFPGGTPATSTDQNPTIAYNAPGVYEVSLTATNALGSASATTNAAIEVIEGIAPFAEGFDDISADWQLVNQGGDATEWTVQSDVACYGNALAIDNFSNDTNGQVDILKAYYDLSNVEDGFVLDFDVAYAAYNNTYYDGLRISVTPCGGEKQTVWSKFGADLATAPNTTSIFEPASCEEWRHEEVDLSAFVGQTVVFEFESVSGYGNQLFLDNILLTPVANTEIEDVEEEIVQLSPNPVAYEIQIEYHSDYAERKRMIVYDELGRQQIMSFLNTQQGRNTSLIDVRKLSPGMYFIEIEGEYKRSRFIVNR